MVQVFQLKSSIYWLSIPILRIEQHFELGIEGAKGNTQG